ncbi:MAG TPA: RidA family protein [Methylomirabilota bacterium]|jgi:enamine deaminase RidA (YjgF/YER057c/UK114 family)|nr:RidA family protein [Methylomirabilota bacterium]
MKRTALTKQAPHPWPFSHGTIIEGPGKLVFLAGQVAYDRQGPDRKLVGPGDPAAQVRQAIENMRTLLRQAGGDLADIVEMTAYVTDVSLMEAMGRVAQEYFTDPLPAMSLIGVRELARPDFLVEIRAIAAIDRARRRPQRRATGSRRRRRR